MSLFTISDLHLSFGVKKPMDIFAGWENYEQKIKQNWISLISPEDTVVIPGDISWGMSLEECLLDFKFIDGLPGTKIILKGNHDYWFSTKTMSDNFFAANGINSLKILHNNAYAYNGLAICGTRGWINCGTSDPESSHDTKITRREAQRLELSLREGQKHSGEILAFLHYPPLYAENKNNDIVDILRKYNVREVYYGHLHGGKSKNAVQGIHNGITYKCVSCDNIDFTPFQIR